MKVQRWYAIADIATGEILYTGQVLARAAWELTPGTCHAQADGSTRARHLVRAVAAEMRGTWDGWRREEVGGARETDGAGEGEGEGERGEVFVGVPDS